MTVLRTPGDPAFSFGPKGDPLVEFPSLPAQAVSLDEVVALSVSRTQAPAGCTAADLVEMLLAASGEGTGWTEIVATLERRGLLRSTAAVPSGPAIIALEAGETEGVVFRQLLNGHPSVAPLEPSGLLLSMAEFCDASAGAAQLLGVGPDWSRDAAMRGANELLAGAAQAVGKARWIQFGPPGSISGIDRIDRLYDGNARYVFLVRHAFDFVDAAYRALRLTDPMVLYASGWPRLLAERGGDYHEALAAHWAGFARAVSAFRARAASRVHCVRYEELVSDPSRAIAELSAFIGEPAPTATLPRQPASAQPAAWEKWPRGLVQQLTPLVAEGMGQLGYRL